MSSAFQTLSFPGFAFASLYDDVSSTMDVAKQRLPEFVALGSRAALVAARSQSAGRGRQGRTWVSQHGAFMGTFMFAAPGPLALFGGYSLAVGVAVAQVMRQAGASVSVKWPNDIVSVQHGTVQKVGGILIEVQECSGVRVLLVGIGLNILGAPDSVSHATSWQALSGSSLPVEEVAESLGASLLRMHERFVQGGGVKAFRDEWLSLSAFRAGATELTLEVTPDTVTGIYQGVDESGALLIEVNGERRAIHSAHLLSYSNL